MTTLEPITRTEQFLADIIEQGGGGGGSGSGGNVLVVNVTVTNTSDGATATFDKSFAELKSAYESGAVMLCKVAVEHGYAPIIAFLNYIPATQIPLPIPEMFYFNISYLRIDSGVVHGYAVAGRINSDGTSAKIYTAEWTSAN